MEEKQMSNKLNELVSRYDKAVNNRSTWDATFDDVIFYTRPTREQVRETNTPGEVRTIELYDSTAAEATINLASNINSLITNQSSKWFELTTGNQELDNDIQMKEWLYNVSEIVDDTLENSNFYTQVHEMYLDLCSIGTGIMYVEEDDTKETDVRFQTMHIKEVVILEDKYGEVDTLFRKFEYTARQCEQRWKKLPSKIKAMIKSDRGDEVIEVIHVVLPSVDYVDNSKFRYASIWFDKECQHIFEEGGYNEFPYLTPRWLKNSNEVYGRSPAINNLPNIKTLNAMVETLLKTGQRIADPPVVTSPDFEEIDLTPGAHNFGDTQESFIKPIDLGANLPINMQLVQMYRDAINDAFMITRMQTIDKRQMTAEEVRARTAENLKVIGPVFGRLQNEFLTKLIKRTIGILVRAGKIPNPPMNINTISLKYLSPLARSQKASEAQSIQQTIGFAVSLAEIKPEILDNIDFDEALRNLADTFGTPPKILLDKKEVDATRAQKQQMAQQQQKMAMQMAQSEVAKNEGSTVKNMSEADRNINEMQMPEGA